MKIMKIVHQEIKIRSSHTKLKGYHPEGECWHITKSTRPDRRDTFISTVTAKADSKNIVVNILYEGPTKDVPKELLDEYLCIGDSSDNPSRPFRWYKPNSCVMTTTEEEINKGRMGSFEHYLNQIENPEHIFIYEIEEIN